MTREDTLAGDLRLAVLRLNRCLRHQHANSQARQPSHQQPDPHPTLSEISALSTLHQHGPTTPSTLAALEQVRPPSMTRIITSLVAAGLITRSPDPVDRRHAHLSITDTGADYLGHEIDTREEWLHDHLTNLNDTDRHTLCAAIALLNRLTDTPSPQPPLGEAAPRSPQEADNPDPIP